MKTPLFRSPAATTPATSCKMQRQVPFQNGCRIQILNFEIWHVPTGLYGLYSVEDSTADGLFSNLNFNLIYGFALTLSLPTYCWLRASWDGTIRRNTFQIQKCQNFKFELLKSRPQASHEAIHMSEFNYFWNLNFYGRISPRWELVLRFVRDRTAVSWTTGNWDRFALFAAKLIGGFTRPMRHHLTKNIALYLLIYKL